MVEKNSQIFGWKNLTTYFASENANVGVPRKRRNSLPRLSGMEGYRMKMLQNPYTTFFVNLYTTTLVATKTVIPAKAEIQKDTGFRV